jgi:hypothetical protein
MARGDKWSACGCSNDKGQGGVRILRMLANGTGALMVRKFSQMKCFGVVGGFESSEGSGRFLCNNAKIAVNSFKEGQTEPIAGSLAEGTRN